MMSLFLSMLFLSFYTLVHTSLDHASSQCTTVRFFSGGNWSQQLKTQQHRKLINKEMQCWERMGRGERSYYITLPLFLCAERIRMEELANMFEYQTEKLYANPLLFPALGGADKLWYGSGAVDL